ncbi:MAG: TonB C-terminal domain-containing protein [Steroidobacter sp.]
MKQDNNPMEVIVIDDPWAEFGPALPESSASKKQIPRSSWNGLRRWPVWSAATIFTVLLHALLLGSLIAGSSSRKHRVPHTEGAFATQNTDATEFVSTLIFIRDHSITTPQTQQDSAYAVPPSLKVPDIKPPEISIPSPDIQVNVAGSDDGTDDTAKNITTQSDGAGEAVLFGRYMGQIKARIERAWDYPADSSRQSFQCTVQIKQNRKGEVLEVTMTRCDNDPAWQLSLAKAIQSASPLSAPPNQDVFTEVVTLTFNVDASLQRSAVH